MSLFFTHQEFEVDICTCFVADFDEASRDAISSKYIEQDFVVHCIKGLPKSMNSKKDSLSCCHIVMRIFLRVCKASWHPM